MIDVYLFRYAILKTYMLMWEMYSRRERRDMRKEGK